MKISGEKTKKIYIKIVEKALNFFRVINSKKLEREIKRKIALKNE